MDLVNKVNEGVDTLFSNNIVYTGLTVFLIVAIAFPEMYDTLILKSGLDKMINKSVSVFITILLIAYLLNKDIRIGILVSILFLSILEKNQINEINNRLVKIIVNDIKNNERIDRLENKMNLQTPSA